MVSIWWLVPFRQPADSICIFFHFTSSLLLDKYTILPATSQSLNALNGRQDAVESRLRAKYNNNIIYKYFCISWSLSQTVIDCPVTSGRTFKSLAFASFGHDCKTARSVLTCVRSVLAHYYKSFTTWWLWWWWMEDRSAAAIDIMNNNYYSWCLWPQQPMAASHAFKLDMANG